MRWLILITPLALGTGSSQPSADSIAVASIRGAYGRIEHRLPSDRHVRHDLHDFSLEGGYLDAWFETSHIEKLSAMYYGEMARGSESYYFVDGALVSCSPPSSDTIGQ